MTQTSSMLQQIMEGSASSDTRAKETLPQREHLLAAWISSNWVLSPFLFTLALGFNLYRLGTPSIWFDEAFSVELAKQPLPLLWHIIFGLEPNMELYYLLLHGWLAVTGMLGQHSTEFVVRLPSAIFAALSTVVVFLLGRRFLTMPAGLVAAGLYLLNDLQLVYAQQARSYSLQLLLTCIAWYAFFAAITGESYAKRWWMCYIGATTLAVYTHLFSLFILLAQLCFFGGMLLLSKPWEPWRSKMRRQVLWLFISLAAIDVLIIPVLLVGLQGSKTGWLLAPHLRDIALLLLSISGDSKIYLFALVACCIAGLFLATLAYFSRSISLPIPITWISGTDGKCKAELQQFLPIGLGLLCWLIVPVVASYIVSQGSPRLFSSRYLVTIVPPLFLLVGMGVAGLRWYRIQMLLAVGLLALALSVVPLYYRSAQVEDWNAASFWLEHHYQVGDGLVCYDNAVEQGCQISIEYYLHAYPSTAYFTSDSPGAFSWATFSSARPDAAVDPTMLASYGAKHPRIFFIVGRLSDNTGVARAKAAQSWLDNHYHLIAQIVTRTVTVRLYTTDRIEMARFIAPQEVFHDSGER